jgi:hypothetical protein
MILTPPFYLSGEAGKTLGSEGVSLANLGATNAVLSIRSLDADTLVFSIWNNGNRPAIPDDGQWITVRDDTGQMLFTGLAKRGFEYPAKIYRYKVSNVYQGMMETPLVGEDGRPIIIYPAGDLGDILRDLLLRAAAAGLPIQVPDDMPEFYNVPKMAFRSATFGSAIEDALKWAPDAVTRMDYSTSPPTLRFRCRGQSQPITIDLESDNHKTTSIELTPQPEQRALSVSMAYARRDGDDVILFLTQTDGDDSAEARRKVSLFLSGAERTDNFVTEALTTAQKAVAMAQASVDAVGASIDAAAASAQITLTWTNIKDRDSNLQAAVTAQPGYTMTPAGFSRTLWQDTGCGLGDRGTITATVSKSGPALYTSGGSLATGWYPIVTGAFTPAELATAGATKETRYIRGWLYRSIEGGSAGFSSLPSGLKTSLSGYSVNYVLDCAATGNYYEAWGWYYCNIAVDSIDMAPTAVAAAVKAAAASGSSSFIQRAEFVEAPDDLAQNYFQRQDWPPYKGSMEQAPSVPQIPEPGDFVNIVGEGAEPEWATMAAPVAQTEIQLETGAPNITIGPSARQDFKTLIDRLRIPLEDNYQPG